MIKKLVVFGVFTVLATSQVIANEIAVNCDAGESLSSAVADAQEGASISVSGTCNELLVITQDNITLDGAGTDAVNRATITGQGLFPPASVITANGIRGLHLKGLNIERGLHGISAKGAASINVENVSIRQNIVMGVLMSEKSLLVIKDSRVLSNGVTGLEIDGNSAVSATGHVNVSDNNVFGFDILGNSSLTMSDADIKANRNTIGIQIGIGSSAFIKDANTTVETNENHSIGTTIVSGGTLFIFEGSLMANNNGLRGISAFTNSNIDLDRSGSITAIGNAEDGISLEDTIVNMFTMAGAAEPRLDVRDNGRYGVVALLNSRFDMSFGELTVMNNGEAGFWADNGSAIRLLNATIKNNGDGSDLRLTFGARAEINASDIGTVRCDKTVLVRGDSDVKCKKSKHHDDDD